MKHGAIAGFKSPEVFRSLVWVAQQPGESNAGAFLSLEPFPLKPRRHAIASIDGGPESMAVVRCPAGLDGRLNQQPRITVCEKLGSDCETQTVVEKAEFVLDEPFDRPQRPVGRIG